MFNVSQTNNAILMNRCNQLQLQLNNLKANYKQLEEDLTKTSTTLKEYADQFTTNSLMGGSEVSFEIDENAVWNAQAIPIRSIHYETDEQTASIKLVLTLASNFTYIIQGTSEKPAETKTKNVFELTLEDSQTSTINDQQTTDDETQITDLSLLPVEFVNNLFVGEGFTPFTGPIYLTQTRKNIYSPGVPSNKMMFSVPSQLTPSTSSTPSSNEQSQEPQTTTPTLTATITPNVNFTVTP